MPYHRWSNSPCSWVSAHAEAFATFLTKLAAGLHAKDKKLGVCVSDWGVDAPAYYQLLNSSKADLFASMGSTYYGSDPKDPTRGGAIDKLRVRCVTCAANISSRIKRSDHSC
jgi:hypothetical protein